MNEASKQAQIDLMQLLPIVLSGVAILLIVLIIICFAFKRRSNSRNGKFDLTEIFLDLNIIEKLPNFRDRASLITD